MKERCGIFLLAVMSGIGISIGGTVYLSAENKVVGSLLFAIGLYLIVLNGFYLYTGKIGYVVVEEDKRTYGVTLLLTWLGNLSGTATGAGMLSATRIAGLGDRAAELCQVKLGDEPVSILILSVFCGLLMYAAVEGYRQTKNPLILFICVSVFILSGFEHCVANMFYFFLAGMWSLKAAAYLLIMTVGNSLGGMLIPAVKKLEAAGKPAV